MNKLVFAAGAAMGMVFGGKAEIGEVRLKGLLGTRLDEMVERHVGGTDVAYLTAPFEEKTERNGGWQTEFWGKYMHAAVPSALYASSPKLIAAVELGVSRILDSQEADGYIGNYPKELRCGEGWDVWGMKYTLLGLLHYYRGCASGKIKEWRQGDAALAAARRLCDFIIGEIGPHGRRGQALWQTGNWTGYASSSILEPVVMLYRLTGDERYFDFASYIVHGMSAPEKGPRLIDFALKGVSVSDRNDPDYDTNTPWSYVRKSCIRSKAYEMMSCYQGILDYVQVLFDKEGKDSAGAKELLTAATLTVEDILREEINLAGGCASCEQWFHGARKQPFAYRSLQETCTTVTWMRLCETMLSMTGEAKWADCIERSFYNAYLASLKSDNSEFAGYTPLSGYRYHGQNQCHMLTDCCNANGPRGYLCFLRTFYNVEGGVATFNFYATAKVKGFDMYSLYPRQNGARVVSHLQGDLTLRLRIPGWSSNTVVKVNGRACSGVGAGSYFSISRKWELGDVVEIAFDMPVVAHVQADHVAFTRGPVLLARDSRFGDGDLMEPLRQDAFQEGQTVPAFSPVRTPTDDFWMAWSATLPFSSHDENPEAANPATVFFCDFASAGNRWRRGNYYRTWFPLARGPWD